MPKKKIKCKYCGHVLAETEYGSSRLIIKCQGCKRKMLVSVDEHGNVKTEEFHDQLAAPKAQIQARV